MTVRGAARAAAGAVAMAGALAGRAADDRPLPFAFASQAGSGIYEVQGRTIQIYRIPISFGVKALDDESRWGASVTLPVTLGFFDFTADDVLTGRVPERVGTASIVPGVRFDVRATKIWVLSPYVEAGVAKEFSSGYVRAVYAGGLKSVVAFPVAAWDGRAGQRLLWAGTGSAADPLEARYAELEIGFECRRPLPLAVGRSRGDIGLFAMYHRYFKKAASSGAPSPTTFAAPATVPGVNEQFELGATFGTRPKLSWRKLSMPKLGVSYRFGDGLHAVRLVIGEVF